MYKKGKLAVAFLAPVILISLAFMIVGIYPFGDKTFFFGDLDCQYVHYYSYLHDMLHGNADWIYTFSKTLGGDMIDMISYYLASPFNIIFFFFDANTMPMAIYVLMLLKIGCMGLVMYIFLSRKDSSWSLVAFSTVYALSGYVITYQFQFMWIDALVFLPLLILFIEDLTRKNALKYSIVLAVTIISNYYTGYMVCVTCGLFFVINRLLLCENGGQSIKKRINEWIRFAFYSLIGGMLSAFVLLPTVFALKGAKMGTMSLKQLLDFDLLFPPYEMIKMMFPFSYYDGQLVSWMPNLYCGTLVLVCGIMFFGHKQIKIKRKIGFLIILLGLLASTCVAGIDSAWHGFSAPTGYPSRFSFIYIFFVIYIAAEFWTVIKNKKKMVALLFTLIVMTECTANIVYEYGKIDFTKVDSYYSQLNAREDAKNKILKLMEQDEDFYRVISTDLNDSWQMNLPMLSSYTSCEQVDAREFLNHIGLGSNNCWNSYYPANTPEILLPIFAARYYTDGTVREALPLGFVVDKSIKEAEFDRNAVEILADMWDAIDNTSSKIMVSEIKLYDNFMEQKGNNIVLNLPESQDMIIYFDMDEEKNVYRNGEFFGEVGKWNKTLNIDDGKNEFLIEDTNLEEIKDIRLYAYDKEEMERRIYHNQNNDLLHADINVVRGDKIEVKAVNNTGESQCLVLSLPKESISWEVYIDGNKLTRDDLKEGFGELMMFDIPSGEHDIVMNYVARGTREGIIISLLGLSVLILLNVIYYVYNKTHSCS